jgi:hypothetical protein
MKRLSVDGCQSMDGGHDSVRCILTKSIDGAVVDGVQFVDTV